MVTDHVSDLLAQIKNAYSAGKPELTITWTKTKQAVAEVLADEGYVKSVKREDKQLIIVLKYAGKTPAISGMRRVSKPGARIYVQFKNLPRVWGGLGVNIMSTPQGIISGKQAKKLHTGGEIMAQVW